MKANDSLMDSGKAVNLVEMRLMEMLKASCSELRILMVGVKAVVSVMMMWMGLRCPVRLVLKTNLVQMKDADWAVQINLVIRMASMLELQYLLDSNLVGWKACQRLKDEQRAARWG